MVQFGDLVVTRSVSEDAYAASLSLFDVARFYSPVGTAGCSRGREPLESEEHGISSPGGATGNERCCSCRPYGASKTVYVPKPGTYVPGYILSPLRG